MLFNSYVFVFAFLPIALAVFYSAANVKSTYAIAWLAIVSFYFYGYWSLSFMPLLIASIAFNYAAGRIIETIRYGRPTWRRTALLMAVACNLCLLAYYKYFAFFQNTVAELIGSPSLQIDAAPIPLGISFFTFTQIAYLVDVAYVDHAQRNPVSYALFVNFFPHLIAGPILHHKETIPQFDFGAVGRDAARNIGIGFTMFSFGLFKKVVLADNVEPFVSLAFSSESAPLLLDAWAGALAYTLQIYFDFSGYSDMAIGLARMFGVIFPLNFNSPYQATGIIDFWRRWHMTLSRFLRDYVYIPLGGNRAGAGQYANILMTMFLGGLWHGAGWTFIIWGCLHGVYLVLNHAWRRARPPKLGAPGRWRVGLSRGVTFLAVVVAWVFFRASGIDEAGMILSAMIGVNGLGSAGGLTCAATSQIPCWFGVPAACYWIAALLVIALFAPNTQQLMWRWKPALDDIRVTQVPRTLLSFEPRLAWALAVGMLFAIAVARLNEHSQFLYYQF